VGLMHLYLIAFMMIVAGATSWKVQDWRYAARDKAAMEQAREDRNRKEKTIDTAATGHEGDKVRIKQVFVPITQEVERVVEKPVYRNICIDADGLRLISSAVLGTVTAGQPARAVPGPAPTR
jgi:hypothetical protein